MIDDFKNDYKKIPQKWTKIPGGPYIWLRKWSMRNVEDKQIQNIFSLENNLIAISSGGGLIATYNTNSSHASKYLNIFSPDLQFLHKILIKLQKPFNDTEWFDFCSASYISFTPDELIVVLLDNFTLLLFNHIGALINFSVYKDNMNQTLSLDCKPSLVRLVSYSLAIYTNQKTFLYISDVRRPSWTALTISQSNYNLTQIFDFIPLSDFSYPLLYCIQNDSTINAILGTKSKDIKFPDHTILGLRISPDLSNIACFIQKKIQSITNTQENHSFYILFSDLQFSPSSRKKISITTDKLSTISNAEYIISNLQNFSNFCWCGKTSILLSLERYGLFVHINGGIGIFENPTSSLFLFPEIDGSRIIYSCDTENLSNNSSNGKVTIPNKHYVQMGQIFISVVPELVETIFTKSDYLNLCHDYIEWSRGTFREDNLHYSKNNINDDILKEEISNLIRASKYIADKNIQQIFLGTSWFWQAFLNPINRIPTKEDKQLKKAFEMIRILHLLREDSEDKKKVQPSTDISKSFQNPETYEQSYKKMLITYEEIEFLSFPTIISRLCNRGAHVTALVLSKIVEEEKAPIFNHKAFMSLYSQFRLMIRNQKKISAKEIVDKCTRDMDNLDHAQLAVSAFKMGSREICQTLLEKEKNDKKKIPVLLLLGEIELAFSIAKKSDDQRIINEVAQYAIDHDKAKIVTSDYNKALLPMARFDEYDKKQISLLVFMIRNMKDKALLSYLFSILKKKLLPPDKISNELLQRLSSTKLLHFHKCFSRYIKLIKWIQIKGEDYMNMIILSGLSSNIRVIKKSVTREENFIQASNSPLVAPKTPENQQNQNDANEQKPLSNMKQENENAEIENESESKSNIKEQENESESATDFEFEPKSKQKTKPKTKQKAKSEKETKAKAKMKSKSKQKNKNNDFDSENESDQEQELSTEPDQDNEQSENQQVTKDKKQKDKKKKKQTDIDSKKLSKKKKDKVQKETQNEQKGKKKKKSDNYDDLSEEQSVNNDNNNEDNDNNNNNIASEEKSENNNKNKTNNDEKNNSNTKNDNINENVNNDKNEKADEKIENEAEDDNKKKKINLKIPFLFRNILKSKSENESKEENIDDTEQQSETEANEYYLRKKKEMEVEKFQQLVKEDQIRFNYGSKIRKNISAMKAIEFELSNGRREEADKIASLLNLSEPRYTWLLINYFLRTNAEDAKLLQLKDKIRMIDGLWVVRRCIVLNRLNIAAAFLENISSDNDKLKARNELQNVITSKQQYVSKVDLRNVLY